MAYKKLPGVMVAKRARKGRLYQQIGDERVKKYAFSPYTAKPGKIYTFFADVELVEPIGSPGSKIRTKFVTVKIIQGRFLDFRDDLRSGSTYETIKTNLERESGATIQDVVFWRAAEIKE